MNMLRPWRFAGLAAGVVVIIAAIFGVSNLFGGGEDLTASDGLESAVAQERPARRDIPVNGSLVFPNRVELTFDTNGEVGEVLVHGAERVSAGQVLARLNDLTVTALEQKLAKAQFDLNLAEDDLEGAKEEFVSTPLEQAEFEEQIAKAQKEVDDASDKLADFQRDYQQTLATIMTAKVKAEVALDNALEQLGYYGRDQVSDLSAAIKEVSAKELALETEMGKLANFDSDFEESLADVRLARGTAELAFDTADDAVTAFLRSPTRDKESGSRIDLKILRRLNDATEEAATNLKQADHVLADLDNGRDLDLQERQAAVAQAEADLAVAQDNLSEVEDSVDQALILQERLAVVESAEATLAQAVIDLEEEILGPDQADLEIREKALSVTQEKLADLTDGPDLLDVGVKAAAVAAAQAAVDDAMTELEGSVVRAPFSGIISLVNVEVEDRVNDKSRVIEIIDTADLEVYGLLDAIDLPFVAEGATSKINIASMPGLEFEGIVLQVAEEPRTERGVVSYPVRIKVRLPAGVEVPTKLSAVTTTITYQGIGGG
jgi:multidrug efflux pump subunit AcrA (membrane-fusion protein)